VVSTAPVTYFDERSRVLFDAVDFVPTQPQSEILAADKRFVLVTGGEQAGKSMMASKFLLYRWLDVATQIEKGEIEGPGLFWLVAADYERTRAEFQYLVQDFASLGLLKESSKRVDPGIILLADDTQIKTKSARDPRTLAMEAPHGIVGCEASQLDLETFYRLRSRCAPRKAWMLLTGTMEGSLGWYPQLRQAWAHGVGDEIAFSLPSYTNTHLYPGGKDDPEIQRLKELSSDDFYMERIEGIPMPPRGLVFPEFRADIHVKEVNYVPEEPVYLWMDPGYAGAYAIVASQEINGVVQIFDEVYETGLITSQMIDVCKTRPWWKDVHGGAIDIAGTQHQAMAAPVEVWSSEGGLYLNSRRVRINEGIERMKSFLKVDPLINVPKLVIHPECHGILSEFGAAPSPLDGQTRAYRWKMDRDGMIVGEEPDDRNNHAIKATIYGLVDRYGFVQSQDRRVIKVKRWS